MIEIGTVDRITALIGERGVGKSTLAKYDALAFQQDTGGFVIGHSPKGYIGQEPYIQFHDSLASMEKGLRRKPELMHIVASGAGPEEVTQYGRALARAMRRQAHIRNGIRFKENRPAPKGLAATPVLIIIDEGTQLKKGMSNAEKQELEVMLTGSRHEHIAHTMLIQAPTARSWTYQEQANRFRVFRYMHEWGLNAIRAAAIPQDMLERIRNLKRFEYFHFDKDSPETAHFARLPNP